MAPCRDAALAGGGAADSSGGGVAEATWRRSERRRPLSPPPGIRRPHGEHRSRRARERSGRVAGWLLPVATTFAVIVAVELIVRGGLVLQTAFPTPTAVFRALIDSFGTSDYWLAVWNTMKGWALGLGLAILVAVPLGILVGTSNSSTAPFAWWSTSCGRSRRSRCCRC